MSIVYRDLLPSEAEQAFKLEKECLDTAWSRSQIEALPDYAVYVAAFSEDIICGIGSMYCIAGEGQIMNIAVSERFRRQGIAEGIMAELKARAIASECENITLEVADNNKAAISLYEKCGYSAVGRRNGFYGDSDAIIMEIKL